MDPTIPKKYRDEEPEKKHIKSRAYRIANKITRTIWFLIIIFIVVEGILFGTKFFANRPNARMCWDESMCYNYCYSLQQAVCVQPKMLDTDTPNNALRLLFTGKRNVVEVLNSGQAYCGCQNNLGDNNEIEEFYNFYAENK